MEAYLAPVLLLLGLAIGAVAAWQLRARDIAGERERTARAEMAQTSLTAQLQGEKVARAAVEAAAAADERAHQEKLAALTSLRGEIEKEMQAIANAALHGNQESFLRLAGQAFETHRQAAATLMEQKEQAIANLLNPVAATLDAYQKGLGGFERAHAVLANEVQNVGAQARKLVTALQASPKTRGRWGEQQLQNVIELAGMTPHVDYVLQQTIEGEDGRLRPDLVIRLPGERFLVVDAKTPLTAYFDANEAVDEALREQHLRRHAQQVRTHLKQLGSKRYWEALRPVTPDFVVMFIPGENFYSAAVERDPDLLHDALEQSVLLVSPTMLIGLAKTVALGWRQEKVAENARHIAELGRELYKRLATMGGHIADVGKGLDNAVRHYNSFVGSLEGRVMPQARKFNELAVEGTREPLPELAPIEIESRPMRTDSALTNRGAEVIPLPGADRAQLSD